MSRWHRENPDYLETGMQPPDPRDRADLIRKRQKEEDQPCARCGRYLNLWSNGLCPDCTQVPETVKPKEEEGTWPCPTCGDRLATINQRCPRCTASIEEDRLNCGD